MSSWRPAASALGVGVPAGLLAVVVTGRPGYRLPGLARQVRLAPTAVATLGVAALAADLLLLTTLGVAAVIMPDRLALAPVTVAGAASLTRLVLNARATRGLLATRAALPA